MMITKVLNASRKPRLPERRPMSSAGWVVALALAGLFSLRGAELSVGGLNGVWELESSELDGQTPDPAVMPSLALELRDGAYTLRGLGPPTKGRFTIDTSKVPAWMDVEESEGPNVGRKLAAIAELTPTGWRACYALQGGSRPEAFKTSPNSGLFLAQYRRKGEGGVKPLRGLLVTGGCCHDYPNQRQILTEGIGARANVEWTVVLDPRTGTTGKVEVYEKADWASGYDVVVHNECFSDEKAPEWLERILTPHRAGVPAVLIHCAMHSYRVPNEEWFKFCGVTSHRHGAHFPHEVKTLQAQHPIMQGFPPVWMTPREELYNVVKVWPTATPLAASFSPETKADEVNVWVNQYGQGRVFGTTIGHYNHTLQDPIFLDLLTRGLLWACDKLGADGKPVAGYGPRKPAVP